MSAKARSAAIHPLVLLSVADHLVRSKRGASQRVVGTLLGSVDETGVVEITNSFGVPFEEDRVDESIWFLDHKYHERMLEMFLKVNAKETVVGWYSSAPRIAKIDIEISKMYRNYCEDPVLVVANIDKDQKVTTKTYSLVKAESPAREMHLKSLNHMPTVMSASGPEEIGVEQLLRDIRDKTVSTLSQTISEKRSALGKLEQKLRTISGYIARVENGELPMNDEISFMVQEIFNDSLSMKKSGAFVSSYSQKSNDNSLLLYVASLVRAVLALDGLVENRLQNREAAKSRRAEKTAGVETPPKEEEIIAIVEDEVYDEDYE